MELTDGGVVVLMLLLSFGYFIPAIIGAMRNHHNVGAIIATNILLGWTFLGWVAAFIWSLTAVKKEE